VAFDFQALIDAVASRAATTGEFETPIAAHEPKSKPGNGMTCSFWADEIKPLADASGLAFVTGLVTIAMRPQTPFLQEPPDQIDPLIMRAVGALMTSFAGNFQLGLAVPGVRNVDLLGAHSAGLSARAGYVNQGGTMYRVVDVLLPVVVNDLFQESP
jgi:hypothetical protein